MVRHCFVPNCRSGYRSQRIKNKANGTPNPTMFSAPLDHVVLEKWKKVIPRLDREFTANDFVCQNHFDPSMINRSITVPIPDGKTEHIPRKILILKPDAIPTIFPYCRYSKVGRKKVGMYPVNEIEREVPSGFIMSEWTESLLSLEKLDRSSPELWPEAIPGVTEYAARNSLTNITKNIGEQIRVLDAEDSKLLNYYRNLNKENLLQELRKLHDLAYKLGLEESKEMTRGRFLNILPSGKRK